MPKKNYSTEYSVKLIDAKAFLLTNREAHAIINRVSRRFRAALLKHIQSPAIKCS